VMGRKEDLQRSSHAVGGLPEEIITRSINGADRGSGVAGKVFPSRHGLLYLDQAKLHLYVAVVNAIVNLFLRMPDSLLRRQKLFTRCDHLSAPIVPSRGSLTEGLLASTCRTQVLQRRRSFPSRDDKTQTSLDPDLPTISGCFNLPWRSSCIDHDIDRLTIRFPSPSGRISRRAKRLTVLEPCAAICMQKERKTFGQPAGAFLALCTDKQHRYLMRRDSREQLRTFMT
jgi:hypothetical protein